MQRIVEEKFHREKKRNGLDERDLVAAICRLSTYQPCRSIEGISLYIYQQQTSQKHVGTFFPSESSGLCQFVGTWKLYLLCTSCSRHQWTATHTIERIDRTGIAVRKPHCRDWNWKDAKIDKRGSITVQWKEDQVFCRSTQTSLSKKIGVYICIKDLNPSSRHEHKGFEIGGDILREFGRCRSREQSNSSLAKMDDNKKSYLDSWLLFFPQLADMGVSFQGGGGAPHCLVKKN